jgi:hypothetical protein
MNEVEKFTAALERVIRESDGPESLDTLCKRASNILGRIYQDRDVRILVGRDIPWDLHGNEYYGKQKLKGIITGYINELKELGIPEYNQTVSANYTSNIYGSTQPVIQQGNEKASVVYSQADNSQKLEELKNLVEIIKTSLDSLNLKADTIGEIVAELETIEVQSKSPKPKASILNESVKSITAILQGVAANAWTPIILKKLQNINF